MLCPLSRSFCISPLNIGETPSRLNSIDGDEDHRLAIRAQEPLHQQGQALYLSTLPHPEATQSYCCKTTCVDFNYKRVLEENFSPTPELILLITTPATTAMSTATTVPSKTTSLVLPF